MCIILKAIGGKLLHQSRVVSRRGHLFICFDLRIDVLFVLFYISKDQRQETLLDHLREGCMEGKVAEIADVKVLVTVASLVFLS